VRRLVRSQGLALISWRCLGQAGATGRLRRRPRGWWTWR